MNYSIEVTKECRYMQGDRDTTETIETLYSDCDYLADESPYATKEAAIEALRVKFKELAEEPESISPNSYVFGLSQYSGAIGGYTYCVGDVFEDDISVDGLDNEPKGWNDAFNAAKGTYHSFLDFKREDYDAFSEEL